MTSAWDALIVKPMPSNPSALRTRRPVPAGQQGLTLIEMIVVLAIIAIVAGMIVLNVVDRPDQARVTVAHSDLRNIAAALKLYRLDNGAYPSTAQGLAALAARPGAGNGGYLESLPKDPWGNPYAYRSPGAAGAGFDLSSTGRDGKPGGEGLDADITLNGQ